MEYTLDADKMNDKKTAHEHMKEVFEFPDYYGMNLDALNDCLSAMNIETINIVNSDKGQLYFYSILDVFENLGININMQ